MNIDLNRPVSLVAVKYATDELRIGVDFGGTKIEAAVLAPDGDLVARLRRPNPGGYHLAIRTVVELVAAVESLAGFQGSVGIGLPGSPSPRTGVMRNANSTYLNGRLFGRDVAEALGREVRLANDANCLALSEAVDGAAASARTVFAVIIGTGCGGGLVIDRRLVDGANGVAGEWGHAPLPWPTADEHPGPTCWCGRRGCLETWVSGTGLERTHREASNVFLSGEGVVQAARAGEPTATAALDGYVDRLARGLAMIVNVLDPDMFVFGGGMSNVAELYDRLPAAMAPWIFADEWRAELGPARWGDSSGVRGAARLWPHPEDGRGWDSTNVGTAS